MPKPFKTKIVRGVPVQRMTGSSTTKPIRKREKKEEQKQLRKLKDWRGLMETYKVKNTKFGSIIEIHQKACEHEGPLAYNLWADEELKGRLRHKFLGDFERDEIIAVSQALKIPRRHIERLWSKEREQRLKGYSVSYSKEGSKIVIRHAGDKRAIIVNLNAFRGLSEKLEHRYFYEFSSKELVLISEKTGIPLWLLKALRKREKEKIRQGMRFIDDVRKKE